jgi:hypothetical protein
VPMHSTTLVPFSSNVYTSTTSVSHMSIKPESFERLATATLENTVANINVTASRLGGTIQPNPRPHNGVKVVSFQGSTPASASVSVSSSPSAASSQISGGVSASDGDSSGDNPHTITAAALLVHQAEHQTDSLIIRRQCSDDDSVLGVNIIGEQQAGGNQQDLNSSGPAVAAAGSAAEALHQPPVPSAIPDAACIVPVPDTTLPSVGHRGAKKMVKKSAYNKLVERTGSGSSSAATTVDTSSNSGAGGLAVGVCGTNVESDGDLGSEEGEEEDDGSLSYSVTNSVTESPCSARGPIGASFGAGAAGAAASQSAAPTLSPLAKPSYRYVDPEAGGYDTT